MFVQLGQFMFLRCQRLLHSDIHGHVLQTCAHQTAVELCHRSFAQLTWPKRLGDVVVGTGGHADAHVGTLQQ